MFEAFSLESGFTSLRKCHLCTSEETLNAHVHMYNIIVYAKSFPRPIISINITNAPRKEWWRFDPGSPWMGPGGKPGPSPFKEIGNVFQNVAGCVPKRIKPDLVHTFHIGFGADLAASCIVWLAKLDVFGRSAFDDKLRIAFSMFQEYCHETKRYTSCDLWCMKKFGMSSNLGGQLCAFDFFPLKPFNGFLVHTVAWHMTHLRTADFPTSVAGKGHDTAVVCRWLQKLLTRDLETILHVAASFGRVPYFLRRYCTCFLKFTWPSMTCCFQS